MMTSCLRWVQDMITSDDKEGGWVKKEENHDDVILEWPLSQITNIKLSQLKLVPNYFPLVITKTMIITKGMSINDVPRFLAFFDLLMSHLVTFGKSCLSNDVLFLSDLSPSIFFFYVLHLRQLLFCLDSHTCPKITFKTI